MKNYRHKTVWTEYRQGVLRRLKAQEMTNKQAARYLNVGEKAVEQQWCRMKRRARAVAA